MDSLAPKQLPTVESALHFLNHAMTPALANIDFNIDFFTPVNGSYAYDETVYTDADGQPYNFWVLGQVISGVEWDDAHLTFKIGPGDVAGTVPLFKKQLATLADPVKWNDDLDADENRNVAIRLCTNTNRLDKSGGSWIQIHLAHVRGQIPTVCTEDECGLLHERVPRERDQFPLKIGDWVLLYAALHKRESWTFDTCEYEILPRYIRVIKYKAPTKGVRCDTAADAEEKVLADAPGADITMTFTSADGESFAFSTAIPDPANSDTDVHNPEGSSAPVHVQTTSSADDDTLSDKPNPGVRRRARRKVPNTPRVEPVDLHVDRLSVAVLRNPTANAVTYFQNNVLVLKDIMAAETRPAGNSLPWVEDVEDGALIYVDVCAYTTVINGPVTHNATVLVDASFHRQDMREADTLTKVYRIIAHDVECIRSSYAGEMGLALTAESDLSTDVESVLADAVQQGSFSCSVAMVDRNGTNFQRLVRLISECAWDRHTVEWFARIDNPTLFAVAMEDYECLEKVMGYARKRMPDIMSFASVGHFAVLPPELSYKIIGAMDVKTRIVFSSTCREHQFMCAGYLQFLLATLLADYHLNFKEVRFVLVATESLMGSYAMQQIINGPDVESDCLDFYTAKEWTWDVINYLALSGQYTVNQSPYRGPLYDIWTLHTPGSKIRVMECKTAPIASVVSSPNSHHVGYCDGSSVRHAYPELLLDGRTLVTPRSMPINDNLNNHVAVWKLLHKATTRGLEWVFEFCEPHNCGSSPNCPTTIRFSNDNGWLCMNLPGTRYGVAPAPRLTSWMFFGAGCSTSSNGAFQASAHDGKPFYDIYTNTNCISDREWYATVRSLMSSDVAPVTFRSYS
ncbi:hypothetical protein B0H13DRAFT_2312042 [Mycena leptocephala]|nr:hypothetical protein B0H13DRAFT_2312042 [Mycena leptocephala]